MAHRGKTIHLFLIDGEADGRIKATISNWVGVAYKVPRDKLGDCRKIDALARSGVYFLFGTGHLPGGQGAVYIGQAGVRKTGGGILTRLLEHDRDPDKDYWDEAVVFTTSNNSFGPTELSFLENRFCNMALQAGRYRVRNGNDPAAGNITEEKESELAEFADEAELILGVLGYKVFDVRAPRRADAPPAAKSTSPSPPSGDTAPKIGRFVQREVAALLAGSKVPADELERLGDLDYCKKVFGRRVYYPVLREWPAGTVRDDVGVIGGYRRYYADIVIIRGERRFLLSSQWYQESWEPLLAWYQKFT